MNAGLFRNPVALGIAALLLVILAAATFAIVPETKQVVVLRLQEPVDVVNGYRPGEVFGRTGAGMIARIPFIDRLVWVDKRVLDLDMERRVGELIRHRIRSKCLTMPATNRLVPPFANHTPPSRSSLWINA